MKQSLNDGQSTEPVFPTRLRLFHGKDLRTNPCREIIHFIRELLSTQYGLPPSAGCKSGLYQRYPGLDLDAKHRHNTNLLKDDICAVKK